ncbi:MAG: hypothetical protein R6X15_00155 [Pseudomonadota bacterium]
MTTENQLLERHIREYQSRMRHIDELMERAQKGIAEQPAAEEAHAELEHARRQQEKLATLYEELKLPSTKDWRREEILKSGPMGAWDALGQQLERLVERLER